ncbi:helix-turn-helix transcriptional regulator [bacterium]|nr:helix-turn-helix transcriptional regulator [bacterium]
MKKKDLISQLEEYRLENKISQRKLAKILGVHYTTINRWLTRKFKPNKIQVWQIRKLINGR